MTKYATIVLTLKADDEAWLQDRIARLLDDLRANTQNVPYVGWAPDLDTIADSLPDASTITLYDFNSSADNDAPVIEVDVWGQTYDDDYKVPANRTITVDKEV